MDPYYYNIPNNIFSVEFKKYIQKFSMDNLDNFTTHRNRKNIPDGNRYYYSEIFKRHLEVQYLMQCSTIPFYMIIMLHNPNTTVVKHVDGQSRRSAVIMEPVCPIENYPPTWFWGGEQWETLQATADFSDMKPKLVNTQQPHNLETHDTYRINVQLCFSEPYEVVKELLENNILFNK